MRPGNNAEHLGEGSGKPEEAGPAPSRTTADGLVLRQGAANSVVRFRGSRLPADEPPDSAHCRSRAACLASTRIRNCLDRVPQ